MMEYGTDWKDFSVIATSGGEKLERWKDVYLLRPDPQVIWRSGRDLAAYPKLNARYLRSSSGGGRWEYLKPTPEKWTVRWRNLTFGIAPMGFKHTGLFPEQSANWAKMIDLIAGAKRPVNVLNLFAYTGGATAACASAGASVCHVDAAKGMVDRARENLSMSNLGSAPVRYIVDDCVKFAERERRRGRTYDAVIMDPPSYGRGPGGEMWKIEENLFDLLLLTRELLSERPLFFLINSYTTGLQPAVLGNLLRIAFAERPGSVEAYEVGLKTEEEGVVLPCGASGLMAFR